MLQNLLFLIKKLIGAFLVPMPLISVILFIGVALRIFRRKKLSLFCLILSALAFSFFANRGVGLHLIGNLERDQHPIPLPAANELPAGLSDCRYVAVLGGGHTDAPGLAATLKLSDSALARIVEGSRLIREMPEATLITTGPKAAKGGEAHPEVMAKAAEELGIAEDRIHPIIGPRDTRGEAAALAQFCGSEPVALVTSAWHMKRALLLMKEAGVNAFPCPTDFVGRLDHSLHWYDYLVWDSEGIACSTWAMHEYLGLVWTNITLKKAPKPKVEELPQTAPANNAEDVPVEKVK